MAVRPERRPRSRSGLAAVWTASALAAVVALCVAVNHRHTSATLACLDALLPFLSPAHSIASVSYVHIDHATHVLCRVQTARPFRDATGTVWPASEYATGYFVLTGAVVPIIVFGLLLVWPRRPVLERLLALASALPMAFFAGLADTALQLFGPLHEAHAVLDGYTSLGGPAAAFGFHAMNVGGRQLLAVLIAVCAMSLGRLAVTRMNRNTGSGAPSSDGSPPAGASTGLLPWRLNPD